MIEITEPHEGPMDSTQPRLQNLASCYENALTIIVRLAALQQQTANAGEFRSSIRAALKAGMERAKALGYSGEINQKAAFAVVALLDESILRLESPSFAEWARRPLQEEMFGHNRAGNVFFEYLRELLGRHDSAEVADCLEVFCLCLLLDFRGQYALTSTANWAAPRSAEVQTLIRQSREKIDRIRGTLEFIPDTQSVPEIPVLTIGDAWSRVLGITAIVLLILVLLGWGAFWLQLTSTSAQIAVS